MSRLAEVIGLASAMAVATVVAGWWVVPVLGALWGLWRGPLAAGIAAMLAWGALLGWQASRGPVGALGEQAGAALSLPSAALPVITVAFAGLLAWSAALVARAVAERR